MPDTMLYDNDNTVNTLLLIGSRVLKVSLSGKVLSYWDRQGTEKELATIDNDTLIAHCQHTITECIGTQTNRTVSYSHVADNTTHHYTLRILLQKAAIDFVIIVVEYTGCSVDVKSELWRKALDTVADGIWDVNVALKTIEFSDKWHQKFGYNKQKLSQLDSWLKLIHPEDIEEVLSKRLQYFDNTSDVYDSAFRVLCENGTYKWVMSRGIIAARNAEGHPVRFIGTHTDIDNHKKAELQYQASAQLMSKLINNLQDGILVHDENEKVVYLNQMFADIFCEGIMPENLEKIDLYAGIDRIQNYFKYPETFTTTTKEVLKSRAIVLNQEIETADGRTLNRDYIPLTLGENNKGGIWKYRDITAQKNTQKQISDLRNFYEQILNHINADIVVFDPENRYLFINPTAIKNPELRSWLIGKTDEDYCRFRNKSFELVERRKKILQRALTERKEIEWEETLINKNGETEHHLRYMYPVFDNTGNHVMGIGYGLNITDRVNARQELKTSRDTFASAFNDSGIGMALLSKSGEWLDINNALCSMTGYSKEELQQINIKDITHPDDLKVDLPYLRKMLKNKISTYSIEKRFISRQHKIVLTLLTISVVRNTNNSPSFFIAQVLDITANKKMELELNKKNAELEATKENLLNKIQQLEDLSHIVAHNLRGPAGNIKMLVESLLTQSNNTENAENQLFTQEESLVLIHDSSIALVDSLATLMQITQIKLNKELPRQLCDVSTFVNETCNQLQTVIFEKSAIIRKNLMVQHINYPKVYLENIFYNLISNALKYTRNNVKPEITITTQLNDENKIQILVTDNGLGIDLKKYKDRVFRLNEIFHHGFDSKGVGLYITKTQIESMGGNITVESIPDQGCEFIVTLS